MSDDIQIFLSGEKLYGDDFQIDELRKWFADEAEAYADLGAERKKRYIYAYHQLNERHGFRFTGTEFFYEALGIGSAYGSEFEPIANRINRITILDPSDAFSEVTEILGTPCEYIKPNPEGIMPFERKRFDLITSLGSMHHIANVSYVMAECYRCLSNGGIFLLREPIVSMGDWRKPRKGLTKRERGIPLKLMNNIIRSAGFKIRHRSYCVFPPIAKLANWMGVAAYNSATITIVDALLSQLFSWNIKYHREKLHEKFAPASIYYVLEK